MNKVLNNDLTTPQAPQEAEEAPEMILPTSQEREGDRDLGVNVLPTLQLQIENVVGTVQNQKLLLTASGENSAEARASLEWMLGLALTVRFNSNDKPSERPGYTG